MPDFIIRKNALGRWIISHPKYRDFAWSGSKWVPLVESGVGAANPVLTFNTATEAAQYAEAV